MRTLTLALAATIAVGTLWSASASAQDDVDVNGPIRQHGLCLQKLSPTSPAGFGYLGPCPDERKAAPASRRPPRH